MAGPELDLVAHELSAGHEVVGAEECFCECGVPPGEECYTCWDCTAVCDAGGGTRCLCYTCLCEAGCVAGGDSDVTSDGALAQNDGGDDGDDGGGDGGEDGGASESV